MPYRRRRGDDDDEGLPSDLCVRANAHALGRFAALSREAGLVPIVEPEVLMEGKHTIERSFEVTARTWNEVFIELFVQRVHLEAMLLKPNMILSGYECPEQADADEAGERTIECLERHVPAAVPGIVFLSGGQSDLEATIHLDALNRRGPLPWELSFSFGRALQAPVLRAWAGSAENTARAQDAFRHRAFMNRAARRGIYEPELEGVQTS